jgi:hypothetical protein
MRFQLYLDRLVVDLAKQGKDASDLRTNFQHMLGFSDSEFAAVRSTGLRLEGELKELDDKAAEISTLLRAQVLRTKGKITELPRSHELAELHKQRDVAIEQEVSALKATLGPEKAERMDTFLQSPSAPSVNVQPVSEPLYVFPTQAPRPRSKAGDRQ